MSIFQLQKVDNKTNFYIFNRRILTIKHKSQYRKIYEKRFKGLSEAEQRYILEQQFIQNTGYPLNLDNPQTFNEKIQWLKLYDHNPLMTICADKVAVRDYIKEKIGEEYLVPALGIYDKPEDIDFDKLPNRFVLKVNWGSGQNIIVKDKSQLDIEATKKQLTEWMKLKNNHYYDCLEWCYKDIKPKILCEQYIEELDNSLIDWKIFCNYGKPIFLFLGIDRFKDLRFNFYDLDFKQLPFKQHYENSNKIIEKPDCFDKILQLAQKLTQDFIHARADFYIVKNKIYFGELTFYHFNGTEKFDPLEWDYKLGELIELPITEK